MATLYDLLLDLIFPARCAGCRARWSLLCPSCTERCRRLRSDPVGGSASRRLPSLTSTAGLYSYEAPLREAIHIFKYRRRQALAGPLGCLLLEALPGYAGRCQAVVAVPLHPSRLRERGFNQSILLGTAVAVALERPLLDGLERTRATDHQVGMDRPAREANVRGAFAWRGGPVPPAVLLVDDVVTTGSTMRECARVLRAAGAREVHGLALAGG